MNRVPGVDGKKVTVAVGSGLAVVLVVVGYGLWVFSRIEQAGAHAESQWRKLVPVLRDHFRSWEKAIAVNVDSGNVPIDIAERFRLAIDDLTATTDSQKQWEVATRLDQMIQREISPLQKTAPGLANAASPSEPLRLLIASYNEAVEDQHRWLTSGGGRLVGVFVTIPELPLLELSASKN